MNRMLIVALALCVGACAPETPEARALVPSGATTAAAPAAAGSAPVAYRADPTHSQVLFRIDHLGISPITGRFNRFESEVVFDSLNPAASRVTAKIFTNSIDTNLAPREKVLTSAEWFGAERFPEITFVSRGVRAVGGRRYAVSGDLTMNGRTRPVTLDATYRGRVEMGVDSLPHAGFVATTTVRRSEFGIGRTLTLPGGVEDLADQVEVILEMDLVPRDGARRE